MSTEDKMTEATEAKGSSLKEDHGHREEILKQQISEAKAEIKDLKVRIKKQKGPGAGAKQKSMQERIDVLQDSILEWEESIALQKESDGVDESAEDVEPFIPKGWQKMTVAEKDKAEAVGVLMGWDAERGIGLIKK